MPMGLFQEGAVVATSCKFGRCFILLMLAVATCDALGVGNETPLPCDSDALVVHQPGRYRYDCVDRPSATILLRPNVSNNGTATSTISLRTTVPFGGIVLECAVVGDDQSCGFEVVLSGPTPLTTRYVPYNALITLHEHALGVHNITTLSIVVNATVDIFLGSIANLTTTERLLNLTLHTTANAVVECMQSDCFEIRNAMDDEPTGQRRFHIHLQGSITLRARILTSTNFVYFLHRVNNLDAALDGCNVVGMCQTDSALIHGLRGFYAPRITVVNATVDLNATHVLFTPQYLTPLIDAHCIVRQNSFVRLYRSLILVATDAPVIDAHLSILDGSKIVLNELGILIGACTFAFWEILQSGGLILYRPHQVIDNLTVVVDGADLNLTSTALVALGGNEVRRSRVVVRNNASLILNNGSALLTSMNVLTTSTAEISDARRFVIGGSPGIFRQTCSILGLLTLIPFVGVNVVNASSVVVYRTAVVVNGAGSLHKVVSTTSGVNVTLGEGVSLHASGGAMLVESPAMRGFVLALTDGAAAHVSSSAVVFVATFDASSIALRVSVGAQLIVAAPTSALWLVGASLASSSMEVDTGGAVTLSRGAGIVRSAFVTSVVDRFVLDVRGGGSLVVDAAELASLVDAAGWLHSGMCMGWDALVSPRTFVVSIPDNVPSPGSGPPTVPLALLAATTTTAPPTSLPYAALGATAVESNGPVQVRRSGADGWADVTFNAKAQLKSSVLCTPTMVPTVTTRTVSLGAPNPDVGGGTALAALDSVQTASVAGIVTSLGLVAGLQPFGALGAVGMLQSTFAGTMLAQLCQRTRDNNDNATSLRSEVLESIGAQAADNPLQLRIVSMDAEGLGHAGGVLIGCFVLSLLFLCVMVLYRCVVHAVARYRRAQRARNGKAVEANDGTVATTASSPRITALFFAELVRYGMLHVPGALVPPCAVLLQPFVTAACGICVGAATATTRLFGIVAAAACVTSIAALCWRVLHRYPLVSTMVATDSIGIASGRTGGGGKHHRQRPRARISPAWVGTYLWELLFRARWVWQVPKQRRAVPDLFQDRESGGDERKRVERHRAVVFEQRYLAVVEPYRRGFHWFFLVEIGGTLVAGAAIGIGLGVIAVFSAEEEEGGHDCQAVANAVLVTLLVVAAALTGCILILRPYVRHIDHVVQVAINVLGICVFALELVGDADVAAQLGLLQALFSVAVALLCLLSWKLPALLLTLQQTLALAGGDAGGGGAAASDMDQPPALVDPVGGSSRRNVRRAAHRGYDNNNSSDDRQSQNQSESTSRRQTFLSSAPPELEALVSMICDTRRQQALGGT